MYKSSLSSILRTVQPYLHAHTSLLDLLTLTSPCLTLYQLASDSPLLNDSMNALISGYFSSHTKCVCFKKKIKCFNSYIFYYLKSAWLQLCVHPGAHRRQKRALDPLGLQLQMTVGYQVSAGNQTQVLCKSNKHS